jgi:transcriptional regulator with XRE-family HTH domain
MVTVIAPAYSALDMVRRGKAYNLAPTVPGTLGAFIRDRRDGLGMTQEDFADRVDDGMTPGDVSQLERGKVGLPKPRRMIALANALQMHVCDLYVAAGFPEFGERERRGYTRTVVNGDEEEAASA